MTDALQDRLARLLSGRYQVEQELGRGGMGIVYLARDVALDRQVAIKLLPPELTTAPGLRARFLQEARTAARLAHPNIVPIHAVEDAGELVWFVMGYIAGETLAERVRRAGPLTPADATRMVQECAWALAYAHQHGVVHRDVKPENILLERGTGRALLTDFGIAQVEQSAIATPRNAVLGTARTVSPEQAAGEPQDGRSDLYSLGVTAFYALTGRYPFEAEGAGALLVQHAAVAPLPVASVRPGLPGGLATAVDRCLEKSPAARYASGEELAAALAVDASVARVPPVLQSIVRELTSFGVDLAGFVTLAALAILTQVFTRDFLGFGLFYTTAVSALLVSLCAARGIQVSRLIREAVREGWSASDLTVAAERNAPGSAGIPRATTIGSPRRPLPRRLRRAGSLLARSQAVAAGWWRIPPGRDGRGGSPCAAYSPGPMAGGRAGGTTGRAAGPVEPVLPARQGGVPFQLLGWRTAGAPKMPAIGENQLTEVLLADQAREFLRALPPAEQERLAGASDLLRRLEHDASQLRQRLTQLDAARCGAGRGTPGATAGRGRAGREPACDHRTTGHRGERAGDRPAELLRARAGLRSSDSLTADLARLQRLSDLADTADAES